MLRLFAVITRTGRRPGRYAGANPALSTSDSRDTVSPASIQLNPNREEQGFMKVAKFKNRSLAALMLALGALLFIAPFQMRPAIAAGAVAMQVDRIIKIAIMEYNSAMRTGDSARWAKYFTDNVKRTTPQASQEGMQAFADYYAWEFKNFEATWTTKRMIVSGSVGAVEFEWEGVHKASGTPVKVNMVAILELASSGKFQSIDLYYDSAAMGDYFPAANGSK